MTWQREYHESSITYPSGPFSMGFVRADGCLCPDGIRRTAYPSGMGIADTFWTLPARVRVTRDGGRFTVTGTVSVADEDVCATCKRPITYTGAGARGWVHEDEDEAGTTHEVDHEAREYVLFRPNLYGSNGYVLAGTDDLRSYVRKADEYARARVEMFAREDEDSRYLDPYRETADERYPHVDKARDEITRREAGK